MLMGIERYVPLKGRTYIFENGILRRIFGHGIRLITGG